jgi:hypothetical protein
MAPHSDQAPRTGFLTRRLARTVSATIVAFLLGPYHGLVSGNVVLTLSEAEQIALERDPTVAASRVRSAALEEDAVADGQLPDPKLRTGLFNLPLDSFSVSQEASTQFRVGVQQAFPRGDTLRYKQKRTRWRAKAEASQAGVAEQRLVRESRSLFAGLVDITQFQYGAGRVSQQDVLRAQLEFSQLDDRMTRILNAEEAARANLSEWIDEAAWRPLAAEFPELLSLPEKAILENGLDQHPEIIVQSAQIAATKEAVNIAREQYKPGWGVGAEFRKRFGDDPNGSNRADMAAVMLTMDLPLFVEKRQDRRLAASQKQADAAHLDRANIHRALRRTLAREYANWQRLGEREALFRTQLIREASANAEASLSAYQSGTTEFTTLMRARITELDIRLRAHRVRVDRAKAQARLLYLVAGEKG